MNFSAIETLLAERLGFDMETVGQQAVDALIRRSMEKAGFPDPEAYARLLASDAEAWSVLIDRVVIPETWFFRDVAPFALIAGLAFERIRSAPSRLLRILSCPCSTGEEPYSLVMALLDAGVPAEAFTVDAVDVSRKSLQAARTAVFHKRSFRNERIRSCEHYFERMDATGARTLSAYVTSRVRFRDGNILSSSFLSHEAAYDFVLCRNLLIYLHLQARLQAMTSLRRLLNADGHLVLGHAEAIFAREHGFKVAGPAAAFAFVKSGAPTPGAGNGQSSRTEIAFPITKPAKPAAPAVLPPRPRPAEFAGAAVAPSPVTNPARAAAQVDVSELIVARRLGDAGQVAEALAVCIEHLERVPDSVEGHFLIGVFHDALGRPDLAATYFRKVLYLDPAHREALLHLALKQEALGDGSGAARLRGRAQRAIQRARDAGTSE